MDDPAAFRRQAIWYRELAAEAGDEATRSKLACIADEYDAEAHRLETLGPSAMPESDLACCYRYVACAIHGTWHFTLEEALEEAVSTNHAAGDPRHPETMTLFHGVRIETAPREQYARECSRAARAHRGLDD